MNIKNKNNKRAKRKNKVSCRIKNNLERMRLAVYRSNYYIYAQIINDRDGRTICSANSKKIKGKNKVESAKEVGKMIAKAAIEKNIKEIVFDRAGYLFHGRVKSLAEGAREGGLEF